MKDNPLVHFAVLGLAITAFILLEKFAVSFFPDTGILGNVKQVVTSV